MNHEMTESLIENLESSLAEGVTEEELKVFYSVIEKLKKNIEKQNVYGRKEELDDPDYIE